MLPAAHRLRRRSDFHATLRRTDSTRRAGRPTLTLHYRSPATVTAGGAGAPAAVGEPARVGFVVSRAVGSAVVRNAVRRRLRALVGSRIALLPPGSRAVVRAQPAAARAAWAELGRDLDSALGVVLGTRRPR